MIQVQTVRPNGTVAESRVFPDGVRLSCEEGGRAAEKWTWLWVHTYRQSLDTFTPCVGGTLEISYVEAA
jgi:hypothetical protein